MNFNPNNAEVFETDGTTFTYNHERAEYISEQIVDQYKSRLEEMSNKYKSSKPESKKRMKHAKNILALHGEWNVEDSDETLYLVLHDTEQYFTDVTTDNEYYANPINKEEE